MDILLMLPGFILSLILTVVYERELRKVQNKVHFYVTRDKNCELVLWLNKPYRSIDYWVTTGECVVVGTKEELNILYGLNTEDFENLKWEDEPLEVFLNLDD